MLSARTLLHDRLRLAISIGAMGFAVLLILLLRAIMDGTIARSTSYIDHVGADVFVARAGVENMSLTSSSVSAEQVGALRAEEGVAAATGIIRVHMIIHNGDTRRPAELVGFEPESGLGGPWKLSSGHSVEQADEVVLDRVLAAELGAGPGAVVGIAGNEFRVVGLSSETAAIAGKVAFVRLDAAQQLLRMPGLTSFLLIRTAPGTRPETIAARIDRTYPELNALTRRELSRNDRDLLSSVFIKPVNVMSTVGFLVGLAIASLTIYTTTAERIRDFGVLKAIGAPNSFLFRTVVAQATALCLAGFATGLGATAVAGLFISDAFPDIGVLIEELYALQVLGLVLLLSLMSAAVPVVRIMRVDPLMVFRR